jgi:hypothetical protein
MFRTIRFKEVTAPNHQNMHMHVNHHVYVYMYIYIYVSVYVCLICIHVQKVASSDSYLFSLFFIHLRTQGVLAVSCPTHSPLSLSLCLSLSLSLAVYIYIHLSMYLYMYKYTRFQQFSQSQRFERPALNFSGRAIV